ncbi:hypothetical protein [Methylocella sp.]|uniref:hypothetical protein n=1 Tax=Methylocella sp. TaxID=1978226 RepID=UPI0035B239AA
MIALPSWLTLRAALIGVGVLAIASAGGFAGFKIGHAAGYRAGWSEGRAALASDTLKHLDDTNAAAAEMDARARACLDDPACRMRDDGWRIDK